MKGIIQMILLAAISFPLQGCAPLVFAGGLVALSTVDKETRKQRNARKTELARQESLRQKSEEQQHQRQLEEQRRQQLAEAERRQAQEAHRQKAADASRKREKELRHQQLAEAERRQQEEEAQQRRAKYEQHCQAETRKAQQLLYAIEQELNAARWSKTQLPDLAKAVSTIDQAAVSPPVAARLHMALGLYAFLADEPELANKE